MESQNKDIKTITKQLTLKPGYLYQEYTLNDDAHMIWFMRETQDPEKVFPVCVYSNDGKVEQANQDMNIMGVDFTYILDELKCPITEIGPREQFPELFL